MENLSLTDNLPNEMLNAVFHYLERKDLTQATLVCRLWRDLGEDPCLWQEVQICVTIDNISKIHNVLSLRRLALIKRIEFTEFTVAPRTKKRYVPFPYACVNFEVLEEVCKDIGQLINLQYIDLTDIDLSGLDPALLSQFVRKGSHLKLAKTHLKPNQLKELFDTMKTRPSMRALDISRNRMSSINPEILAETVNKLEAISMNGCFLGIQQVTHLFGQIYRETRLVKLEIGCNDLSFLNGKVLVGSIKKMKHLALFDTHLDKEIV